MSCKISQDLGSFNRQDYVRKILCFSRDSCQIVVRYGKYTYVVVYFCIGLVFFLYLSDILITKISLSIPWQMNVHELRSIAQ